MMWTNGIDDRWYDRAELTEELSDEAISDFTGYENFAEVEE